MIPLGSLPSLGSFMVPGKILLGLFGAVVLMFVINSLILFYHWQSFEFDKIKVRLMGLIYFFGGILVLFTIYNALVLYGI